MSVKKKNPFLQPHVFIPKFRNLPRPPTPVAFSPLKARRAIPFIPLNFPGLANLRSDVKLLKKQVKKLTNKVGLLKLRVKKLEETIQNNGGDIK